MSSAAEPEGCAEPATDPAGAGGTGTEGACGGGPEDEVAVAAARLPCRRGGCTCGAGPGVGFRLPLAGAAAVVPGAAGSDASPAGDSAPSGAAPREVPLTTVPRPGSACGTFRANRPPPSSWTSHTEAEPPLPSRRPTVNPAALGAAGASSGTYAAPPEGPVGGAPRGPMGSPVPPVASAVRPWSRGVVPLIRQL